MGRYASDTGGGDFRQAPEGTHIARCVELIDIGTHHGEYQGKPNTQNQIIVRWELPGELIDTDNGAQPMIVSRFYTNSLGEKANLLKDLTAWRGRAFTPAELAKFDLQNVLGVPCMVTVIHNDKGKAKVSGVSGLPKGVQCPPAANPLKAFWMDEWNGDINCPPFTELPKGFQTLIKESDEYKVFNDPNAGAAPTAAKHVDTFTDDIPFN
jgi:hypothetical protein